MNQRLLRRRVLAMALTLLCGSVGATEFVHPDHYEFDAMLNAPFKATAGHYPIVLRFDYPTSGQATSAAWILDAEGADGQVIRSWNGIAPFDQHHIRVALDWDGRDALGRVPRSGYYTLRLRAVPTVELSGDAQLPMSERIASAFAAFPEEVHVQEYDVMLGNVAASSGRAMKALKV